MSCQFSNFKYYAHSNIGLLYIGRFDGGYTILAKKENANILIHGTKKLALKRLQELGVKELRKNEISSIY